MNNSDLRGGVQLYTIRNSVVSLETKFGDSSSITSKNVHRQTFWSMELLLTLTKPCYFVFYKITTSW